MPQSSRFSLSVVITLLHGLALLATSCSGPLEPPVVSAVDQGAASLAAETQLGPEQAAHHWRSRHFFPLEVGNSWLYDNRFRVRVIHDDGSPDENYDSRYPVDVRLVCEEIHDGRSYVVQRETGERSTSWFRYRQDRTGLYVLDAAIGPASCDDGVAPARAPGIATADLAAAVASTRDPAARQAYRAALDRTLNKLARVRAAARGGLTGEIRRRDRGGPLPGEIGLLRYPLHRGKQWRVRDEGDFVVIYTVEGHETLSLPVGRLSGWRIRIDLPYLFGPNDRATVWYGRAGLLALRTHGEGEATDELGNPIGTVISDHDERLASLSLVRPPKM